MFKKRVDFKRALKSAAIYVLVIIVAANIVSYVRAPSIEDDKPHLYGVLTDGNPASIKEYEGKPLILHFWATWCPTCKLESPVIESLSKEFQVLTVAVNSGSSDEIVEFMNERGYSYKVVNDIDGDISRSFKVKAFPTTFVLDSNGSVIFTEVGYTSNIGFIIRMKIADD